MSRIVEERENKECPKCGGRSLSVEHRYIPEERLEYKCGCSYIWSEKPKDYNLERSQKP